MIDPLTKFKESLLKTVEIQNKKFTFNPFIQINSLDPVELLSKGLKEVNGIKLVDFDSIKIGIENGLSEEQAIKTEILSWDSSLTELLVKHLISLIQKNKEIDFDKEYNLRAYWKLRKIFSKDEIDNWDDLTWQWAYYNLNKDELEKEEFDNRALEKRKPWYDIGLWNNIRKQEEVKKQQKLEEEQLLKKLIADEKLDRFNNVEFELVDAEENDIPTIIGG